MRLNATEAPKHLSVQGTRGVTRAPSGDCLSSSQNGRTLNCRWNRQPTESTSRRRFRFYGVSNQSGSVISAMDLSELFRELLERLKEFGKFDFLTLSCTIRSVMRLNVLKALIPVTISSIPGIAGRRFPRRMGLEEPKAGSGAKSTKQRSMRSRQSTTGRE